MNLDGSARPSGTSPGDTDIPIGGRERQRPENGRRPPRVRRGRLWFRIHSFVGLNLSLLIAFICLTGTLAVFAAEFDWFTTPEIRAERQVPVDDIDWEGIATSLSRYAPGASVSTVETGPSAAFAPAAYVMMPDGTRRVIRFDPATGVVQGEHSQLGAKSLLRGIHSRLLFAERWGILLVTFTAFFLLASLVTALFAYRRWWRGFFRMPRRGQGARVFWGDFHRLFGLWSLIFGAVIAVTSIWYFAEEAGWNAPPFEQRQLVSAKPGAEVSQFRTALIAAREAYPELSIRRIDWPDAGRASFVFYGQDGTALVRPRASGIAVDPATAEIEFLHRGGEASAHQRISEGADPLHMGLFAGFWSKLMWFISGWILTLAAFSGAVVYAKRLAGEAEGRVRMRSLAITLALPLMAMGAVLALLPGAIAALS